MMSMASSSSSHLKGRPLVGSVICGASKAQASLAKIMAVISTVPPSDLTFLNPSKPAGDSKAAANVVDLNIRLGLEMEEEDGRGHGGGLVTDPPVSTADDESISPAESVAGQEKSSEDECDLEEDEEGAIKEEKSEITNVEQRDQTKGSSSSTENGRNSEGLDLLIDVLGDELEPLPPTEPEEEKETEKVEDNKRSVRSSSKTKTKTKAKAKKRSRETTTTTTGWLDSHEETAPLVRSKRGRNQTLPSRYRDTLLEPWAKLPTVNRHGCRRQQQDH